MSTVLAILASIACSVYGQIALKAGMNRIGPLGTCHRPQWTRGAAHVISGLAVYALSTLLWLYVLSRVELSFAYPFLSLSFVAILVGARWGLGESFPRSRIAGGAIVVAGVLVVGLSHSEFGRPVESSQEWIDSRRPVLLLLRDELRNSASMDPSAEWYNLLTQAFGHCDVQPSYRLETDPDSLLAGRSLVVLPRRVLAELDLGVRSVIDARIASGELIAVAEAPDENWAHSLGLRIASAETRQRLPWPFSLAPGRFLRQGLLPPQSPLPVAWSVWRYAPDSAARPISRPVANLAGRPATWNRALGRSAWVILNVDLAEVVHRMRSGTAPEADLPWADAWSAAVLSPQASPLPWPRLEPRPPGMPAQVRSTGPSGSEPTGSALPYRALDSRGRLLPGWLLTSSPGPRWSDWNAAGLDGPELTVTRAANAMNQEWFESWWTARQERRWTWSWEDPWLTLEFESAPESPAELGVLLPQRWRGRVLDDWQADGPGVASSRRELFGSKMLRFSVPARATRIRLHFRLH